MTTQSSGQEYVLGRGRLFFDAFPSSTVLEGDGERYLGNTPSVQMTQAVNNLDHFSSESGLRVKDFSVELERTMSGQFQTDNISVDNIAEWFNGGTSAITQAGTSGLTESITVQPGLSYQIGVTDDNPMGVSNLGSLSATSTVAVAATGTLTFGGQPTADDTVTINSVAITFKASGATGNQVNLGGNAAGTAQNLKDFINAHGGTLLVTAAGASNVLVLSAITPGTGGNAIGLAKSATYPSLSGANLSGGSAGSPTSLTDADWTVDMAAGRFTITIGGGVAANSVVALTYTTLAASGQLIVTSESPRYGALRYIADNPTGDNTDYYWPYVKLTGSGNLELKGDTWQQIEFSFEVLKKGGMQRAYGRRRAA